MIVKLAVGTLEGPAYLADVQVEQSVGFPGRLVVEPFLSIIPYLEIMHDAHVGHRIPSIGFEGHALPFSRVLKWKSEHRDQRHLSSKENRYNHPGETHGFHEDPEVLIAETSSTETWDSGIVQFVDGIPSNHVP